MDSRFPSPALREQRATRLLFLVLGCAMAAWASLVPFAKSRTGLDDGSLGLLLLCLGTGSIIAMPIAGALAPRYGCRALLAACTLAMCACLPLLAVVSSAPLLGVVLFVFGAAVGAADCAVNVQAVIVEKASGKAMMSGFHGFYSLGGIVGAAGLSGLMTLGISPMAGTLIAVALLLLALWRGYAGLLPYASPHDGPPFAIPHGVVLFLGVLAMTVFLAEGAMLDWSAVFLTQERGISSAQAGFGYACFSLAMTAGRLSGDAVVHRLGPRTIVAVGGLLAAFGLALATLLPYWQAALLGYTLVGLGCANIVPVLFSAVGRQTSMPQAVAVPAMTTLGYAGVLAGPAGIGFIAHHSSLPVAFLIVTALMVGVAASSRWLRF
ncbi:Inner membrane protein YbjJ [Andreprevotia sp. IGB-42]|uniref:MFS transporter n=1 Tax=Andreprevotia sp. IGB-42 TaxID=2497473 RepID=UPI00157E9F56|nr:MFS transporter [Andreprevotia sp. IGB-42]KAF0811393.1 Inner membrane protein YbjJ [Andreprevotia sp. IGB-42]